MSHVLPNPTRSLAIPLATLVLGAGCGVAATAVLNDDEVIFKSAPAAVVEQPQSTAAPVPERVTNAPAASSADLPKTTAPVPERVAPQPQTSSLSGIAGSESPAPVPERVSGAHSR
jgi:hypothetical protein